MFLFFSIIFIGLAFLVNEKNAKYLLAGYNTMSQEERQKFDIKSYIPFFRKFHIFLGISLFIICLAIHKLVNPDWSFIVMVTYPLLAYVFFIWKGNQFSKSSDRKQKRKNNIALWIVIVTFLAISAMLHHSMQDNTLEIHPNTIEIKGEYGTKLQKNEIKSVELVDKLPKITAKINGVALESIKKGYFKTENGEKVRLLLYTQNPPFIYLTTNEGQKIYYSSKNKSNQLLFDELKNGLKK